MQWWISSSSWVCEVKPIILLNAWQQRCLFGRCSKTRSKRRSKSRRWDFDPTNGSVVHKRVFNLSCWFQDLTCFEMRYRFLQTKQTVELYLYIIYYIYNIYMNISDVFLAATVGVTPTTNTNDIKWRKGKIARVSMYLSTYIYIHIMYMYIYIYIYVYTVFSFIVWYKTILRCPPWLTATDQSGSGLSGHPTVRGSPRWCDQPMFDGLYHL